MFITFLTVQVHLAILRYICFSGLLQEKLKKDYHTIHKPIFPACTQIDFNQGEEGVSNLQVFARGKVTVTTWGNQIREMTIIYNQVHKKFCFMSLVSHKCCKHLQIPSATYRYTKQHLGCIFIGAIKIENNNIFDCRRKGYENVTKLFLKRKLPGHLWYGP